jgi:hypothetical protein
LIGSKAKELNKDLETLVNRFRQLKDIDYDHNKIDYLYQMTEKALESNETLTLLLSRLKAVETIHRESTNIARTFETVE